MILYFYELRNSLCAVRFAVGILRMEKSRSARRPESPELIERQVAQMTRLG